MAGEKFYLTLLNGTGYIFDVEDYMQIRTRHRIVGNLVGTTMERGSVATDCRLPVELTPFETRLVLEEGIAELVSKQESLLKKPTTTESAEHQAALEARLAAQADLMKAEKLRDAEHNMDQIIEGKRKKLLHSGKSGNDSPITAASVLEDISKNVNFDRNNAMLEIACGHPEKHVARLVQLSPLTPKEALRYCVFRDLWLRGKYITPGDAFGADFLIYPGDPILYHATHIVVVLDTPPRLKLLELISKVRLTVAVKKICVFAYQAEDLKRAEEVTTNTIHYQIVEWDGNSLSEGSAGELEKETDLNKSNTDSDS